MLNDLISDALTTNSDKEAYRLLEVLGMPFSKGN